MAAAPMCYRTVATRTHSLWRVTKTSTSIYKQSLLFWYKNATGKGSVKDEHERILGLHPQINDLITVYRYFRESAEKGSPP